MIKDFFDEWGGLHLYENQRSDNSLLFLAYLESLGALITVPDLRLYEVDIGLLKRDPTRDEDSTSFDENLGAAYISSDMAIRIVHFGITHNWYFDNLREPKFNFSYWRQPSHRHVFLSLAGMKSNWLNAIWFNIGLIICMFHGQKRTSEILLQRLMNHALPETLLSKLFDRMISKRFGGWINVWRIYFQNDEHPIMKQAVKYYENKKYL